MKQNGWSSEDINIVKNGNALNVIYIFKKEEKLDKALIKQESTNIDLEEKILNVLEKKKEQEKVVEETNKKEENFASGKKIYLNKCQRCHGKRAEIEVYGSSRKLRDLSQEEMEDSIRGYQFNDYSRGKAIVMKPFADLIYLDDVENIYNFIQTIK